MLNPIPFTLILLLLAAPMKAQDAHSVTLTLNCSNEHSLPRNFRTTTSAGLTDLNASASGQFSEKGLVLMLNAIPSESIVIVDLREESHCFVNGHAISWRTEHNWANRGKSLAEIEMDEKWRQQELLQSPFQNLTNDTESFRIHPSIVFNENELTDRYNVDYIRIPVSDHRVPRMDEVDQYVRFYHQLDASKWVHYHCSAGKGRSGLFMVMHDIMENAGTVSLNDILIRQGKLGGKNFTLPISQTSWKAPLHQERMEFIHQFYRYRLETKGQFVLWSEWCVKTAL